MREDQRKCLVCGSSPGQDPDITLYRFPKPGKNNSLRCELWAKYCFPCHDWSSPKFQKKMYDEHRMLCQKHFELTSFIDYAQKKLHRHAAPTDKCDKTQPLRSEAYPSLITVDEIASGVPTVIKDIGGPSLYMQPGVQQKSSTAEPYVQIAQPPTPITDVAADIAQKQIYQEIGTLKYTIDDEDIYDFENEVVEDDTAYEAVLVNTELRMDREHVAQNDMDQEMHDGVHDSERPKKDSLLLWQKSAEDVLPLDTEGPKKDGLLSWQKSTEDVFSLDEKQCAEDVVFLGESQLVPDLCDPEEIQTQSEFSCNVCKEPITGFRYACAQCRDWDLCGACEARGEHATHFVLRIPPHKTRKETQTVLTALRQLLDGLALHEDPSLTVIKDELKTEDPLLDDATPQEPSEVRKDAEADTGQANKGTEPLDEVDSVASEDELYEAEYLETESEADVSSVEDSITDTPIDKVYATRQKRKLSCADHSDTVPQKVQKQDGQNFQLHYDNSTSKLTVIGKSKSAKLAKKVAPLIKLNDLIDIHVDRNTVTAPHAETDSVTPTNNSIKKPQENQNLIAPHTEKDCNVSEDNINNIVLIACPNELSLSAGHTLELSSLALSVDANETQYMTLDGQPVEVIDFSKDLRVNVTRLAADDVRSATGPRGGKR